MKRRKVIWTWEDPDAQAAFARWVGFPDSRKTSEEVERIETLVGLEPPLRVLDVGCGTGRHALEMARRGYDVTGIDVARTFLAKAEHEAASQGLDVRFRLQRGTELSEEGEYDFALAYYHTLGFMERQELDEHFKRIRLALQPQGSLLLVLAGPKVVPGQSTEKTRSWCEKDGEFILTETYMDEEGYRNEFNVVIDTRSQVIIEYDERQKAFTLADVMSILGRAGFPSTECFADLEGRAATLEEFGVFLSRL